MNELKFFFKQMLKVSAFYLEKQKSFIPKKNFLGRCQYQNKKALFTGPIFSEGFGDNFVKLCLLVYEAQYKIVGEKQSKIDTWTSWPQFNEAVIIGELGPCGINVEYIG